MATARYWEYGKVVEVFYDSNRHALIDSYIRFVAGRAWTEYVELSDGRKLRHVEWWQSGPDPLYAAWEQVGIVPGLRNLAA